MWNVRESMILSAAPGVGEDHSWEDHGVRVCARGAVHIATNFVVRDYSDFMTSQSVKFGWQSAGEEDRSRSFDTFLPEGCSNAIIVAWKSAEADTSLIMVAWESLHIGHGRGEQSHAHSKGMRNHGPSIASIRSVEHFWVGKLLVLVTR